MEKFIGILTVIGGVLGLIGSSISVGLWWPSIIILSILKLTDVLQIDWFSSIFEWGAISTGLWLLLIGFITYMLSLFITAFGTFILKGK